MATATQYSLSVLVLVGCFSVCAGGEFCTTGRTGWSSYSYDTTYCVYGCCGYYPEQYCCSYSVGVIVGGVFGAIAGISLLVALICCCVRSGQRGRVVTTQPWGVNNTGVAVVSTNANSQYAGYAYGQPMGGQPMGGQPMGGQPMGGQPMGGQPMGGQPMGGQPVQPPPYSGPAPAYGYSNPTYPPAGAGDATYTNAYNNAGYNPKP